MSAATHKVPSSAVSPAASNTIDVSSDWQVSLRTAAIVAGLGILAMAGLSFFGTSVLADLVTDGNATRTAHDIVDREGLFRVAALSLVVVAVLDVVVAWALYIVLRPANSAMAVFAAWLRLIYAAAFIGALTNLYVGLDVLTTPGRRNGLDTSAMAAQALLSVNTFQAGWDTALVVFGMHLAVLGYVIVRSGYIPTLVGALVGLAGAGYVVDSVGGLLSSDYHLTVAAATFIGEVVLMVWLLWKGRTLTDAVAQSRRTSVDRTIAGVER